jgi:hypothetical protein
LGAKSPIVSGLHLKYSRFLETRGGDRARSALRGVGRSLTEHFHGRQPQMLELRELALAKSRDQEILGMT